MFAVLWILLAPVADPIVVVDRDDVRIESSCRISIPPGTVIADSNGDGVIHIVAPGINVLFCDDSVLLGAPEGTTPDKMTGTGIRVEAPGVTLRNIRVQGFRIGVWGRRCDGLHIIGGDLRNLRRDRLRSLPEAPDDADTLNTWSNDSREWFEQYGAACYMESAGALEIRQVTIRSCQNGIVFDRVNGSTVSACDVMHLSGWGVALWRSSRNIIVSNGLDFCVRGYSHSRYAKGYGSAGVLISGPSSKNFVAKNSCIANGTGILLTGGSAGLHQMDHGGSEDHQIVANSVVSSATVGIHVETGMGNQVAQNAVKDSGLEGIRLFAAHRTWVSGNQLVGNGRLLAEPDQTAIRVDHGYGTRLTSNSFNGNTLGVLLTASETPHVESPWFVTHGRGTRVTLIADNDFRKEKSSFDLAGGTETYLQGNRPTGKVGAQKIRALSQDDSHAELKGKYGQTPALVADKYPDSVQRSSPGDREGIVLLPFGPWDGTTPSLLPWTRSGRTHRYEILSLDADPSLVEPPAGVSLELTPIGSASASHPHSRFATVSTSTPGVTPYDLPLSPELSLQGELVCVPWDVTLFPWTVPPSGDADAWARLAATENAITAQTLDLGFSIGDAGPAALPFFPAGGDSWVSDEHFGILAGSKIDLPAGNWVIRVAGDAVQKLSVEASGVMSEISPPATPDRPREHAIELTTPGAVTISLLYAHEKGNAHLSVTLERVVP